MTSVNQFIEKCQNVIVEYEAGGQSLNDAAARINASPFSYPPFEGPAHPMLYKVADIAFDIAENYRSEKEDRADWLTLTKTFNDYLSGNWEPTCRILTAIYGEYSANKLIHSYNVVVRRQNGKNIIETAADEIKEAISQKFHKLNTKQTDERYLQNLEKLLPKKIGKHWLAHTEVREYLAEPYYSTMG